MTKNKPASKKANKKAKLPPKPKTEQERIDAFQADYIVLCNKHGLEHIAVPSFRRSMDTGVFGIIVEMRARELPNRE